MSFSNELKRELSLLPIRNACCRKSFAYGILLDAPVNGETNEIAVSFPDEVTAQEIRKLFTGVFGKMPAWSEQRLMGQPRYQLSFSSHYAAAVLSCWENRQQVPDSLSLLSPGCDECRTCFLRGALIGCAGINDPHKESHLEFHLRHPARAAVLYPFLSDFEVAPKIVNRKNGCGIYYKSSAAIEDILLALGAKQAGFAIINGKIESEIRNEENRATNCVTKNIGKSVSASQKQMSAIHRLRADPLWNRMPEELRVSATLRMENENATLGELADLHHPPISKSGLNHRLQKLVQLAEELPDAQKKQE